MTDNEGMIGCGLGCWLVAALGGALAAVLLMVLGDWLFIQGAFVGAVLAAVAGLVLSLIMCRPLPAPGAARPAKPAEAAKARPAPAPATAAPAAQADVKPSTPLAGETELAARKGEWKYETPGAAPPRAATPQEAAQDAAEQPDPVAEAAASVPEGQERKPETLSAAREGGPDDLKMIKGVGPKLEALLHSLGFYHFDQIAGWQAEEVAWVDQNLQGFKGRVSRDKWVAQAKVLASGGSTAFSKKVKKGDVYE